MNSTRNGSGNYYNPAPSPYSNTRRPASAGDTDMFMAIASNIETPAAQQPAQQPAQQQYGAPQQPAQRYAPQPPAQSHRAHQGNGSAPVNPLVAARNTGGSGAHGSHSAQGGLFPIQEVNPSVQRGFDTSFGERGGKKTVFVVFLVIALIAALFVGAFYFLNQRQAADARTNITDAIEVLRGTDSVIVPLDAAIASQVSTGVSGDALTTLMLQSSSTSTKLSTAETLANEAERNRDLLSEQDAAALDAVTASISGRRSLLETGRMLLSANSAADKASESLAMAYGCIANANALAAQALADYVVFDAAVNTGSDAGGITIWTIMETDANAVAAMTEAQTWVASAKEALPTADLSALENYISLRLNYLNLLLQIDTLISIGDYAGADAIMPAYNDADAASQNAYLVLPATAAELLSGVYSQNGANQQASFTAAHDKCLAADTQLSTYLGITDASKKIGLSGTGQPAVSSGNQPAALTEPVPTPDPVVEEGAQPVEGEIPAV